MKYLSFILLAVIFSTTSYARVCFPNHANSFRKFMNTLVIEQSYFGIKTRIETPTGGTTTIAREPGGYFFSEYPNRYNVHAARCSDDGQCDILSEETWVFSKGCLIVDGVTARIISSTQTLLRFDYVSKGSTYRARYELTGDRRLNVNVSRISPEGVLIQGFTGAGYGAKTPAVASEWQVSE